MTDLVLTEIADGIATVTLNRPEAMNALSKALRHRLYEVMTALDADDGVRAVILTGAGTRAFTAGLDLKELGSQEGALGAANAEGADENPVKAIESCRKPVIGAINGVAITGGFEVALACDVLIASSNARFADTHARVGVVPGWGLSQKLSRMIGISRAKELSFTGNFLDAATAERWGLVNRVVAPESLLAEARRLAADMASVDPAFLAGYKRLIDEGYAASFGEGLAIEHRQSSAANSAVRPAELEARRAAVQARGRTQGRCMHQHMRCGQSGSVALLGSVFRPYGTAVNRPSDRSCTGHLPRAGDPGRAWHDLHRLGRSQCHAGGIAVCLGGGG